MPLIILPKQIQKKIKKLCNSIHYLEWSGILLYEVTAGSIKEPDSMEVTVRDIIPMHKGSLGFTKYAYAEGDRDRHIEYCNANPDAAFWIIGQIHSHHNMGVFFSGEDIDEIETNGLNHNFYLSLIVNNRDEMIAKMITFATAENSVDRIYKATDENGELYELYKETENRKSQMLISYDCMIKREEAEVDIEEDLFDKNLREIIANADNMQSTTNQYETPYYKPNPTTNVTAGRYYAKPFESAPILLEAMIELNLPARKVLFFIYLLPGADKDKAKRLSSSIAAGANLDEVDFQTRGEIITLMSESLRKSMDSQVDIYSYIIQYYDILFNNFFISHTRGILDFEEDILTSLSDIVDTIYDLDEYNNDKCTEYFDLISEALGEIEDRLWIEMK